MGNGTAMVGCILCLTLLAWILSGGNLNIDLPWYMIPIYAVGFYYCTIIYRTLNRPIGSSQPHLSNNEALHAYCEKHCLFPGGCPINRNVDTCSIAKDAVLSRSWRKEE